MKHASFPMVLEGADLFDCFDVVEGISGTPIELWRSLSRPPNLRGAA